MRREQHGPTEGTTVMWNDNEGWGAVEVAGIEGHVWVHFSDIRVDGYRSLRAGQRVRVRYESPGQDGYPYRALTVDPL
jgi:CspA family cold shock protein